MLINNLAGTYIINIIAIIVENKKTLSRIFRDYKLPCVTDKSVGIALFFRGTINGCTLGKHTMLYSTCVYGGSLYYIHTYIYTCIFHGNNHIQLTIGYAYNDLFLFLFVLYFGPVFCFLCFCFVLFVLCSLFSIFVLPSV